MKGADLLVSALENEGVTQIFGVPGEEKPGVCLSTLGPGALNFTTGAAYALLGAMPMVMITGQKGILSRKQARFQVVDIVSTMTPLTKMARQIASPAIIPSLTREAFRIAQQERPGPVHLELPEDIA